jgi:hypothetical protein
MFRKPLFVETIILFLIVAVLHFFATIHHLYWSIGEFDSVVHFFAGFALALFFSWFYFFSGFFSPQKRSLGKFLLVTLLGSMFVAISWEIYELIFRQTMVQKVDYPFDLMMDIIMDFLGTVAGCFYSYLRENKVENEQP